MGRLAGERIVLREFREEDLSGMRSWMIDAESTRYLGGNTLMPPSWEMSETALRRLLSGDAGGYNRRDDGRVGIASGIFFAVFLLGILLAPLIGNFLLA